MLRLIIFIFLINLVNCKNCLDSLEHKLHSYEKKIDKFPDYSKIKTAQITRDNESQLDSQIEEQMKGGETVMTGLKGDAAKIKDILKILLDLIKGRSITPMRKAMFEFFTNAYKICDSVEKVVNRMSIIWKNVMKKL